VTISSIYTDWVFFQNDLFADLKMLNFTVFTFQQPAPEMLQIDSSPITTHIELHRNGHSCLLVLLYERGASVPGQGDFWHAKLLGPPTLVSGMKKNSLAARTFSLTIAQDSSLWRRCIFVDFLFLSHAFVMFRFPTSKVAVDGVQIRAPTYPDVFLKSMRHSKFIECNSETAHQFHLVYPKDESTEAQKFRENARSILLKAKVVLDELGIPFWLSSGTCLGKNPHPFLYAIFNFVFCRMVSAV
jgi:hypothetical protein